MYSYDPTQAADPHLGPAVFTLSMLNHLGIDTTLEHAVALGSRWSPGCTIHAPGCRVRADGEIPTLSDLVEEMREFGEVHPCGHCDGGRVPVGEAGRIEVALCGSLTGLPHPDSARRSLDATLERLPWLVAGRLTSDVAHELHTAYERTFPALLLRREMWADEVVSDPAHGVLPARGAHAVDLAFAVRLSMMDRLGGPTQMAQASNEEIRRHYQLRWCSPKGAQAIRAHANVLLPA